jgi:hypothetical protein
MLEFDFEGILYKTAKQLLNKARKDSSGHFSPKDLRRLKSPYAEKWGGHPPFGIPYGDAGIINKQKGDFYHGWELERTDYGYSLNNTDDKAEEVIYGDGITIPRPIDERLERYLETEFAKQNFSKGMVNSIVKRLSQFKK